MKKLLLATLICLLNTSAWSAASSSSGSHSSAKIHDELSQDHIDFVNGLIAADVTNTLIIPFAHNFNFLDHKSWQYNFASLNALTIPGDLAAETGVSADRILSTAQMLALMHFAVQNPEHPGLIREFHTSQERLAFATSQFLKDLRRFKIADEITINRIGKFIGKCQGENGYAKSTCKVKNLVSPEGVPQEILKKYTKVVANAILQIKLPEIYKQNPSLHKQLMEGLAHQRTRSPKKPSLARKHEERRARQRLIMTHKDVPVEPFPDLGAAASSSSSSVASSSSSSKPSTPHRRSSRDALRGSSENTEFGNIDTPSPAKAHTPRRTDSQDMLRGSRG